MTAVRIRTALVDGALDIATAGAFLAMWAIWLDAWVVQTVHRHLTPALDTFFNGVSTLAHAPTWAATTLCLLAGSWLAPRLPALRPCHALCTRLQNGCTLMLLTLLTGGLITWLLKQLVARARPALLLEQGQYGIAEPFLGAPFNSFPSSHAFTAFALAGVLGHLQPKWRAPLLALAACVGMSRVLTLEHFPSDVLASALIAAWCVRFWSTRLPNTAHRSSS